MKRLRIGLVLGVATQIGCAAALQSLIPPPPPTMYESVYRYELSAVERPAKTKERYGPQTVSTIKDSNTTKYSFEDNLVSIVILPGKSQIDLAIKNKTDHSIKILWNDAAFVDAAGQSSPVMHVGVKYSECSGPKSSSVVVQRSLVSDNAIPCRSVRYSSGTYTGGWYIDPLVQGGLGPAADTARLFAASRSALIGKHVNLLLPIQVEDVVNDYLFEFKITGDDVRVYVWNSDKVR